MKFLPIAILCALPLSAQSATDFVHGGVFSVSGDCDYSYAQPLNYDTIVSNTLLDVPPTSTTVTIPATGNYLASASTITCTGGANSYIESRIRLNGQNLNNAVNKAHECGTAATTTSFYAEKGDIVEGLYNVNQGVRSSCHFSLSLVGIPYN